MNKKILFVLTKAMTKRRYGRINRILSGRISHPWEVLHENAGYEIDFVSPKGGNPPVDGFDLTDPVNKKFWEDKKYKSKIANTMKPSQIIPRNM